MENIAQIIKNIKGSSSSELDWETILKETISAFDCSTGTIHVLDQDTQLLMLKAQQGIPDFLLPKMGQIPIGKGMAGIAAERKQAVEMCNLQTDDSGVARPAAKETKVEGSIAVPMLLEGELFGVLGVAKPVSYDFKPEEREALLAIGSEISKQLVQN